MLSIAIAVVRMTFLVHSPNNGLWPLRPLVWVVKTVKLRSCHAPRSRLEKERFD